MRYKKRPFCAFIPVTILILCLCMGCNPFANKGADSSSVICAQVNGKAISLKDCEQEIQKLSLDIEGPQAESEEEKKMLNKEILLMMIDRELLLQEAKSKGIRVGQGDLEAYLKEIAQGYPSENFPVESHLKDPEYEKWRILVMENLLTKKLIEQFVAKSIDVTEEEARSFYLTHQQEFEREKEYRVRQIVVESAIEAQEIRKLLDKGNDFARLARERSLSPDSVGGGELGFFRLGQMPPEFDDAVCKLKKGEISDVVQSDYGYHVFQLLEVREQSEATWADAATKIKRILIAKKRDEAFHELLAGLRSKATIKIYPHAMYTQ